MSKLKILRKGKNLTNKDMGELLNISKVFYWQLENNKRVLTYQMAYKIALIFKLKPDDIFYDLYNKKSD